MRLLTATFLTAVLWAGSAATQTTLPYDHVHLAAPDQARAVEWYHANFGGETTAEGKDRLLYGQTRFIWMKAESPQASRDSAIDHICFAVADIGTKMRELAAAGANVITQAEAIPNVGKRAFVEDPWGVRIEIIEDAQVVGFHHVHLASTEPARSLDWYQKYFGGERARYKGQVDGLRYGDVWVFVRNPDKAPTPSAGHALDHVGWRVTDLNETLNDLKGISVVQAPRELQLATAKIHFAFVEDAVGTEIELVQR
jgi:catechol 2,3-dioxygenase-like lactoylglutathione lyase family enzyme